LSVLLSAAVLGEIRAAAAAAYPYEGCGALLGTEVGGVRAVSGTLPLPNREADKPRVRFAVSPRDYMDVEAEAERRGLLLLGFWHSHPDHPARPSETDRAYAWVGLLTLVIAVEESAPRDLTAWEILAHDAPFVPVALTIEAVREGV
jgi:proteasome lid subunit RPN8/RPN11